MVGASSTRQEGVVRMIILGLILLIIGLIANIGILTIIGAILLVVGLILNFVPIGGTRRRFY
jgi:membrane protein implicated in regulation of membrane protease activity